MLPRITVANCVSMAGVGGKRRYLSGGTGFLTISGILLSLSFHHFGAAILISSTIAIIVSGSMEEVFRS